MARVIFMSDFKLNYKQSGIPPEWYFSKIEYSHGDGFAQIDIGVEYPESCMIHRDILDHDRWDSDGKADRLRIDLRRWVERNLGGDVIVDLKKMDYRVQTTVSSNWNTEEIKHGYYVFHFESSADAVHFRLKFSELLSEVVPNHPTKHFGTRWM